MILKQWIGLYLSITTLYSLYVLIPATIRLKSLKLTFFSISLISFLSSSIFIIFDYPGINWLNLSTIIWCLCGLFSLIRDSKPVFARFPVYFSLLPLISFFFYPIIIGSNVIENLVMATYQGGAILVGLLIVLLHQIKYKSHLLLLLGVLFFLMSYILFWFMLGNQTVATILLGVATIITSLGLISNNKRSLDI